LLLNKNRKKVSLTRLMANEKSVLKGEYDPRPLITDINTFETLNSRIATT